MIAPLMTFLRGLRLLRHRELVRRLGELRLAELEIEELRRRYPGVQISSGALITGWREGTLQLASGAQIEHGTLLNLGDQHNGFGTLIIGERTWIGQYNNMRLAAGATIRIGNGCLVSQFCTLVGANHSVSRKVRIAEAPCSVAPRDVSVGDDVWIGAGAVVLPGVVIGDGAIIGAGSVVTHSVREFEIWGGNPASKIGVRPD
jgi:acetyltransferase-like isoleucine patch superfamily enzyme